jgi:hypothetical protein
MTHSSLWLTRIEQLYKQSLIDRKLNLTKTQYHLLSSCCRQVFNKMSTTDIYHLCLFNHQLPLFHLSETKAKLCLPILENITLQKICYRDYCHQWLKNTSSIYRQKFDHNYGTILEKRRDKLSGRSIEIQHRIINDNKNYTDKYNGLLCRVNSTWGFRLIDSRYYPNFGQNIGVNNSRTIIVLQSKVRDFCCSIHSDQRDSFLL